jgi:hypothetical protein
VDIVVDLVSTNAIVHLHALHDGIVHLYAHFLIGRCGEIGDDEDDSENDSENERLAKATVHKSLRYCLVGLAVIDSA